ncbi:MAG: DUF1631 family protein [Hydrogenophaga sp.]|uniref:DUF1631 family protein n=2 Tax=Bacteria TaxID=2 RepID=UPI00204302F2|nr:DUF1631 family protein [Hydrogenophaga intermedia]MCM3565227.1 DUF1631 domain-containing protein [Hydrogenophaga intermedia]
MPNAPLPVFEQCLNEALELTRQWVPEWLNRLQALLREREAMAPNYTERTALIDAYSALQRQREPVARHWLSALAEEMEEAPTDLMGLPRRTSLRLDELELMGDDQVQEKVEVARVQQAVTMAAEDHFHEFTARLSTAQGFRAVNAEANPLRVQVYVDTLLSALKAVNVPAPVRARWLQVGGASLGKALSDMYLRLDNMLAGQGVKPAGYNVVTAPDSRAVVEEELAGTDLDGPMTEREALLTLDHLHQLLVGSDDANGHAVSVEMTRSIAAEVVSLMMQRIAGDKRLLKPVRSQLQDMKPALLELARDNPRFFADRDNPARRLLDNVTAHALAFTSEQEAGFSTFLSELRRTVNELRRPGVRLEERFPTELDRLRRSQDASVPRGEVEARGRAMQTLVRVEQRKLLAEKVAEEFRARPDYPKAPGPVRRFLTGVWALVVAKARIDESERPSLQSGDSDAKRFVDILTDLLWSCQLALASQNRPRLVKVIPPVLRTLREGLDSIDYPREKVDAFFQTLMGVHEAAYKTQRSERSAAAEAAGEPDASVLNPEDADLWMRHQEAQETNFYDDSLPESTQPAFQNTQPMQRDWSDIKAEMALRDASSLTVGSWFDLLQDGQLLRVQLTWASPHGTLFLFGSASGRSLSMTRRGVDRLIEQDKLRMVADHSVVDEALDAVAEQALKNSGKR